MPEVTSSTDVGLNTRPDVKRDLYRDRLSKTQLNKGTFYKFLLQSEIPFTPKQYVNFPTTLYADRLLKKNISDKIRPTVVTFNNLNKISIVCQLDGVYIDDQPVYVEIRYKNYEEMGNGERNRLLAIQNSLKLITFFHDDFEKLGIEREEDDLYIQPMTKRTLKRWANMLFSKLRDIEGETVEIPYSLVDVKANIDKNASDEGDIVRELTKQNSRLRKKILHEHIASNFHFSDNHEPILDTLVSHKPESLSWIDKIMYKFTEEFIFDIDLRTKKYKGFFTQKNGALNPMSKPLFTEYILKRIQKTQGIYAIKISDNIVEVCNKVTFQSFTLLLNVTNATDIRYIKLDEKIAETYEDDLVFTLTAHYGKISRNTKPVRVVGGVLLGNNYNKKYRYTKNYIVTLFNSNRVKGKYIEWAV